MENSISRISNPHESLYKLNPEASAMTLYDAITQRLNRASALAITGSTADIYQYNKNMVEDYFMALDELIGEVRFFCKEMYQKLNDKSS